MIAAMQGFRDLLCRAKPSSRKLLRGGMTVAEKPLELGGIMQYALGLKGELPRSGIVCPDAH